jgi:hypothetical protein
VNLHAVFWPAHIAIMSHAICSYYSSSEEVILADVVVEFLVGLVPTEGDIQRAGSPMPFHCPISNN